MANLNKYLNNDYFSIGRADNISIVRIINITALSILIIISFVFIFFLTVYSTTYYSRIGDLEETIKEYKTKGQLYFDNINIGLKIMPSYNTENNVIFMEKMNDFKRSRIKEANSLMETYNMNYSYFIVNKTENVFPKLDYKQESIPVGNSITMCLNLAWAEVESKIKLILEGRNFELMKEMTNFPQCEQSKSGRFIWNDKDTKFGMDVPIWVQHEHVIDCANDNECDYYCEKYYNAEFVNGKRGKKCFSYEVLSAICLSIVFNPVTNDWQYAGGCFKDNKNYLLEPAVINKIYNFSGIEIEIRNKRDPIIEAGLISNYTYNFGAKIQSLAYIIRILFYFSIIVAIVLGIVIYLEKGKKSKNLLIEEKPSERKDNNTESNLKKNNTINTLPPNKYTLFNVATRNQELDQEQKFYNHFFLK